MLIFIKSVKTEQETSTFMIQIPDLHPANWRRMTKDIPQNCATTKTKRGRTYSQYFNLVSN